MKMGNYILLLVLVLLSANVQAQEYYRSIDANGKVQYGDAPAKDAADVEKIKSKTVPDANDSLPFVTRRASLKFPVMLYVGDGCGEGCAQARDFLNKRGIPFTEKNLVSPDEITAFKKASKSDQVPVMHIGADWLQRFNERQWSQALDTAGYPPSAPYGYRPAAKSSVAPDKNKSE